MDCFQRNGKTEPDMGEKRIEAVMMPLFGEAI